MPDEVTWSEAPQSVIHTAERLIEQYHPWLQEARIAFVMRSVGQKRGNRLTVGNTCKVPAKMQPYLEYDFLIWLSDEDYQMMSDASREALIDHELQHCYINIETGGWALREHDVQEFAAIIERHGYWSSDLRGMESAANKYQQKQLPGAIPESESHGGVTAISGAQLKQMADVT